MRIRALLAAGWAVAVLAAGVERADLSLPPLPGSAETEGIAGGEGAAAALAHYSCALQFEAAGKLREALRHYQELLKLDPGNSGIALHTAELTYNFQGREAAVALLEGLLKARPDQVGPYLNLAQFRATYAPDDPFEKDRVAQTLADALKRFPKSAEVYSFAATAYLTAGQREDAEAALAQAARQEGMPPSFWLEVGRAAQKVWPLGQFESREANLRRVNALFEKAVKAAKPAQVEEVRLEVAQYYLLSNQLAECRKICEQLSATGNLQARKILYRLYESGGEKDLALKLLEEIVRDAPHDVEQLRLLAIAYEAREEFDKAIPPLEAAIQIGGGDSGDYVTLGEHLLRSQQYEKAVRLSQRSVRLFPEQAWFHVQAALAHRALQQLEPAVASFAKAAEIAEANQSNLVNYKFYYQYGITLERAGRHDEAGQVLEKSIVLTPKDDQEEAANTMNYLGYMWVELGRNLEKAGELIKKANELHPDSPAYIDSLGWWYFKKGDLGNARKELERAVALIKELQPEDAEIVEHLGQVCLKMGDAAKAREHFAQALALEPKDGKLLERLRQHLKAPEAKPEKKS